MSLAIANKMRKRKIIAREPKTQEMFGRGGENVERKPPRQAPIVVTSMDIAISLIVPSPFQPRKDFPPEEIQSLADSIAEQGQIHPIALRAPANWHGAAAHAPQFELVDGERRLRACKLLGLQTIRAEIGEYSDADVRAIVLATALQRRELNAIEEARAFRAAIDAGDAAGPTELATQLGLSQGQVSNRLRLLELPDAVQQKVISHEISATNARALVPFAALPAVVKDVLKEADGNANANDFSWEINEALQNHCRRLGQKKYSPKINRFIEPPKFSEAQRTELKVVEHGGTEFATNTQLFDQIWAQHESQTLARLEKQQAKKSDPKPLSPAEAAAKEKERAEQFGRRLAEFKADWMRYLIAEAIKEATLAQVVRVLMLCSSEWQLHPKMDSLEKSIDATVRSDGAAMRAVFDADDVEVGEVVARFTSRLFWADDAPVQSYMPDLPGLCKALEIDFELSWNYSQAGPLSERFWRLHSKDQLIALAGELKAGFDSETLRGSKEQLVAAFLAKIPEECDVQPGLPMPRELKKIKSPK